MDNLVTTNQSILARSGAAVTRPTVQQQPVIVNNAEHWMVMIVRCYFNPSSGSVIVNDFNSSHKVDTEWDSPLKYFRFNI